MLIPYLAPPRVGRAPSAVAVVLLLLLSVTSSSRSPLAAAEAASGPSAAPAAAATPSPLAEECVDVPLYAGINAIPAWTMEIYPSINGDTVTNDMACLPGEGRKVVVGYWEHSQDYHPEGKENPCLGEPAMKIAYPVDYGSTTCFCWKHYVSRDDIHMNSARDFSCAKDSFALTQWTDLVCGKSGTAMAPAGQRKTLFTTKCCRDNPPTIWSLVLNFSGCAPP